MPLERITRVIFPSPDQRGEDEFISSEKRKKIFTQAGLSKERVIIEIPRDKIVTADKSRGLVSGQRAVELFAQYLEHDRPDSFILIAFPGLMLHQERWRPLAEAVQKVRRKLQDSDKSDAFDAMLEKILGDVDILRDLIPTRHWDVECNPAIIYAEGIRLAAKISADFGTIMAEIQRRVRFMIITPDLLHFRQGQVAVELGILSGAFDQRRGAFDQEAFRTCLKIIDEELDASPPVVPSSPA